jgi:hypothetical protein
MQGGSMIKTLKIIWNTLVAYGLIIQTIKVVGRTHEHWHEQLIKMLDNRAAFERMEHRRLHNKEVP